MKAAIIFFVVVLNCSWACAQFENKLNLYAGIGFIPFEHDQSIQTQAVFSGYRAIPFLHAYVGYALNRRLAVGGAFRQILTSKENYLLSNSCLGAGVKYNILPYDKPISPFVYVELGINYTYLSQTKNSHEVQVAPSTNPSYITVNSITPHEPKLQLNIFPSFSALVGTGAEFTLKGRKKNIGLFMMVAYSFSNTASNKQVTDNFPLNTSEFNYLLLCGGLRFSFLKRKSLY